LESRNINIHLNDSKIETKSIKEIIKKANPTNVRNISEAKLYEGQIIAAEQIKEESQDIKEEQKSSANIGDCNQGILLYFENRLVRRYENNTLGNLDFLSDNSKAFGDKLKSGQSLFNNNGYISLKSYFKPNLFKTEIENPYYSNYFHVSVSERLSGKVQSTSEPEQAKPKPAEEKKEEIVPENPKPEAPKEMQPEPTAETKPAQENTVTEQPKAQPQTNQAADQEDDVNKVADITIQVDKPIDTNSDVNSKRKDDIPADERAEEEAVVKKVKPNEEWRI